MKRKGSTEWVVPVSYTFNGYVIVEAASAEEAKDIIVAGGGPTMEPGEELVDWDVRGPARENI